VTVDPGFLKMIALMMKVKTKMKSRWKKNLNGTPMMTIFHPLMIWKESTTHLLKSLDFVPTKRLSSSIEHQEDWRII